MAERTEGHVVLRVRDTGVGIPAATLPYVFDSSRRKTVPSTARKGA